MSASDGEMVSCAKQRIAESISGSPTLADDRDILQLRDAGKQYLVHSIRGTHKGDLERGMPKEWPTLDITR
jgi:hypothetical protein